MADTLVEGDIHLSAEFNNALRGPYWSDISTSVIVSYDLLGQDISFFRTTDKGATWSKTVIDAGNFEHLACWYDQETPGDSGTLLHLLWADSETDDFFYRTIDVATGALGTQRVVASVTAVNTNGSKIRLSITKSRNGNLYAAYNNNAVDSDFLRSVDGGATWVSRASFYEATRDWAMFFPANTGDDADIVGIYWDVDADAISVKMYDDNDGNDGSWTETSIDTDAVDDTTHMNLDGVLRHSDGHVLFAFHSDDDTAGDDLRTYDITVDSIASPTITAKTNIFTNQAESAQVAVFINQQDDEVRIAYLKGGTWTATVDCVFHISTDGMGAWGTEKAYSEAAADDIQLLTAGRSVGNDGGRYQPAFYNDDLGDIFVNEVNDVEIVAVSGALTISEVDGLTSGETQTTDPVAPTDVDETQGVTLGEIVSVLLPIDIPAQAEALAVGESVSVDPLVLAPISEAQAITVVEVVVVDPAFPHDVSVSEGVTVGEATDLFITIDVSASDAIIVAETVSIDPVTLHNISASDDLTLGEAITVEVSTAIADLSVDVSDDLTVGEVVSIDPLLLDMALADAVAVGETTTLTVGPLNVSLVEAITTGENIDLLLTIEVAELDAVTVGEVATITLTGAAPDLSVVETELIAVGDVITLSGLFGGAGPPWKQRVVAPGIEIPEKRIVQNIRAQKEQHAEKLRDEAALVELQDLRSVAESRVVDRQNDQVVYEQKREARRQSSLVNLELARMAREKEQARKDVINKARAKVLRKARAAKKRKAKK